MQRTARFIVIVGSVAFAALLVLLAQPAETSAADPTGLANRGVGRDRVAKSGKNALSWAMIEPGLVYTRYRLGEPNALIHNEAFLLKVDSQRFAVRAVRAQGPDRRSDIRSVVLAEKGIAGINANFFDEKGEPLGLLVDGSKLLQKMHRGGNVLTGIFFIRDGVPGIAQRDSFELRNVSLAVQAGPRLVANRAPLKVGSIGTSRRSGIAITGTNELIFYATVLRFPGASFSEIQSMLQDPALDVVHALNLDGGGSSQLYAQRGGSLDEEVYITGGDTVPVGLVISRR